MIVFDYDITQRKHFTGKDGESSFDQWKRLMGIPEQDFPFKVKTNRFNRSNHLVYANVVSWGFYQGSDWAYYVFITYRTSDNKLTTAYHWDVDENAKPIGTPRKYEWVG